MNYKETVDFLFAKLPMFQRTGPAAYKANLDNTIYLDKYFGEPHKKFKSVHIAGTNGKGSVSHMLASVLQSAGYKTALYTSPHLLDFRERMKINGQAIPEEYVISFVEKSLDLIEKLQPSFFELTTIMAFSYFADMEVDIAVIETGMGGRLDSTNIIIPVVSVITNIGLDHTQFLGDTLELIAAEKAGIIKNNIPVVIGEYQKETKNVFDKFAEKSGSEIFYASGEYSVESHFQSIDRYQLMNVYRNGIQIYKDVATDLRGFYQRKNLAAVLKTIDCLNKKGIHISEESMKAGLKNIKSLTGLRGRWEEISYNPLTVCDTGHNAEGIALLVEQIKQVAFKQLHFVFGMVGDKDSSKVLSLLPKEAIYYFTQADIPRALDHKILKERAEQAGLKGDAYSSVEAAFKAAQYNAGKEDFIFVGGSTFVVAEVLALNCN
ncbi:MAG: bifunctional folylpolyglutamate synthase/dihydrofolate synthase [Bacteroidales bacterium]|nr:bifunctional folylpolyglutamate synthase/dihydrofolate synthase [Bacteroidales bacterium]MCB8999359.1 bifunctional folylpolyglutamate synthase/dihydrofolate synthase [Bacteroidales bacterium]MCB9013398.1 bifunctional folylpolyglutamate synthase/dihydrofolate synthase [Bacteroidales bacterium]